MAVSMQMNSGLCRMAPIIQKSSFKSESCQARTVEMHSGKANFYEVLSLDSNDVSQDDIKKAYRAKALEFHPDTSPTSSKEESTRRFMEIRLAYEILSDPISREIYNYELSLLDSVEKRNGSWSMERRRSSGFSRVVWERQLQGLKERSRHKFEKRRNQCMNL